MTVASVGFIIFCIVAGFVGIISAMLLYHWVRYGTGIIGTFIIMALYTVGTAMLILSLLGVVEQL